MNKPTVVEKALSSFQVHHPEAVGVESAHSELNSTLWRGDLDQHLEIAVAARLLEEGPLADLVCLSTDIDDPLISRERKVELMELGVLRYTGFGRYRLTMFGTWIVESHFHQLPTLPLSVDPSKLEHVRKKRGTTAT